MKLNKPLIKLTISTCNIPKDSPYILAQLYREIFSIEAFSLLPRYATTLSKQLIQTLNDLRTLGKIYQAIVRFIVNKYGGVEHLSQLMYQACSKSQTVGSLYILRKYFNIHLDSIDTIFPFNNSGRSPCEK